MLEAFQILPILLSDTRFFFFFFPPTLHNNPTPVALFKQGRAFSFFNAAEA